MIIKVSQYVSVKLISNLSFLSSFKILVKFKSSQVSLSITVYDIRFLS